MYRQFVKNLDYFIELNNHDPVNNYRLDIAKSIQGLSNISKFLELKESDIETFNELSNIISMLEDYIVKYPGFETLSWELWGYGFEGKRNIVKDSTRLDEQLKLIDLLLGTQYWH